MRMLMVAGLVVGCGLGGARLGAQSNAGSLGTGQMRNGAPVGQSHGLDAGQGDTSDAVYRRSIQERQEKARNDERQKRLVADTERLLTLATQLRDDVGKTDKNILSLDVVRRSEEIEKLARAVKERMRN